MEESATGSTEPVRYEGPCPHCEGAGHVLLEASEEHIRRAKLIDPAAWSEAGNARRRSIAAMIADRQMRGIVK